MVNVLEIGLFLYALAGSASIGYWILVSILPSFRQQNKATKLGYGAAVGAGYILVVFALAAFLSLAHFNNMSFLQLFFWLVPISFILLSTVFLVRSGREVLQKYLSGELRFFGENAQETTDQTTTAPAQPVTSAYTVESIEAMQAPAEPLVQTSPSVTGNEFLSEPETEPEKEPATDSEPNQTGEHEMDVEEEIRRIMRGEKAVPKPAEKPERELDEIEKIKAELKKKIAQEKENQEKKK